MALIREQARGVLRWLRLPQPTRDRTLNVVIEHRGALPAVGHRCTCSLAANHAWRLAHEHGCTRIVVHNAGHKPQFDTIDFLKQFTIRRLGYLPRPFTVGGRTPRWLATRGHQALGNVLDTTRPTFQIPITVSGVEPAGRN